MTESVKNDIVTSDLETTGKHGEEAVDATMEFEYLAAAATVEVVVVTFAGKFIPGRSPREFHRHQPTLLDQRLDVSVDGREAQTFDRTARRSQNMLGR